MLHQHFSKSDDFLQPLKKSELSKMHVKLAPLFIICHEKN